VAVGEVVMAFVKVGDVESITAFLDDDKVSTCDKCGKILDTIKVTAEQNEPVCSCEDKDDE
jgi:hypothetical protein